MEILEDYVLGETSSINEKDEIVAQTVGWKISNNLQHLGIFARTKL